MSENDIRKGAQITVVSTFLYSLTLVNVVVRKKRCLRQARQANKTFDRYTSPQMHNADRLVGNFLEWSPIFMGLIWPLAVTGNLSSSSVLVAWTYVALRALYIVLEIKYGVASDGLNKPLWISTFPSYICLNYLLVQCIRTLFL
jgi:uncharacterized MAPEG superfamily protein